MSKETAEILGITSLFVTVPVVVSSFCFYLTILAHIGVDNGNFLLIPIFFAGLVLSIPAMIWSGVGVAP